MEEQHGIAGLSGTRVWVLQMHGSVASTTVVVPLVFGHRSFAGDGVRRRDEQMHEELGATEGEGRSEGRQSTRQLTSVAEEGWAMPEEARRRRINRVRQQQ
jgi:hypothetical protein